MVVRTRSKALPDIDCDSLSLDIKPVVSSPARVLRPRSPPVPSRPATSSSSPTWASPSKPAGSGSPIIVGTRPKKPRAEPKPRPLRVAPQTTSIERRIAYVGAVLLALLFLVRQLPTPVINYFITTTNVYNHAASPSNSHVSPSSCGADDGDDQLGQATLDRMAAKMGTSSEALLADLVNDPL